MRELMLKRIEAIRNQSGGFPKSDKRWDLVSNGTIKTHVSDLNFEACTDHDLILLFERIVKRYYAQM